MGFLHEAAPPILTAVTILEAPVQSAVQPNVSIAATFAFGALVVALGISKARDQRSPDASGSCVARR